MKHFARALAFDCKKTKNPHPNDAPLDAWRLARFASGCVEDLMIFALCEHANDSTRTVLTFITQFERFR